MSQTDIDVFVDSVDYFNTLTPEGVTAAVARGISVNERHSSDGVTALHNAVLFSRHELVVALLAAGAHADVRNRHGTTSMWAGAAYGTADILQLLIDSEGSVNEADSDGETPLIALVRNHFGDAAARLQVLLVCNGLDLDAKYRGRTAEEWAVYIRCDQLASAIAQQRARRERWSALRAAWIGVAVTRTLAASYI
jgi:ankyrin repeat protein